MARIIFIDGLPGAGKTTMATWLAHELRTRGYSACVVLEGDDPHPLHAFWTWGDGFVEGEVISQPFDPAIFSERLIERFCAFVAELASAHHIGVVEAYPFQSVVRAHLRMGATPDDVTACFDEIVAVIAAASPLLVLIDHADARRLFTRTLAERGERFACYFIGSIERSPYGRKQRLAGLDGVLAFYETYAAEVERLVRRWPYRLLRVNPDEAGWTKVHAEILAASLGPTRGDGADIHYR